MNLIRNPKSLPVLGAASADGRTRRREATAAGESSMPAKTFGVSAANGGSSSPLLDVTNVGGAEKYLASPDGAPKAFASRLADPPISNRFCCRGGRLSRKFRGAVRRGANFPDPCYKIDMEIKLTAVFRKFPEGYAAFVEELPGANTQGATLEEARENLKEAVAMVLQANRELAAR